MNNGGFLGKFLSLLLGFILGIVGTIGGVVGVGYYIGSQPIDKAAQTIDNISGLKVSEMLFGTEDTKGLLSDAYADKYVKDLLGDTGKALGKISNGGTLSDLNAISPKVEELVNNLLKTTDKFGIPLTSEGLMNTPFKKTDDSKGLANYFLESFKSTVLGKMLKGLGEEPTGLMLYLCYGEEGVDFEKDADGNYIMLNGTEPTTVKDLLSGDFMPIFEKVPLASVTTPTVENTAMLTISYGRLDVTYQIDNDDAPDGTKAEVTMLPLFYEKKDGEFVDYAGNKVEGTVISPSDVDGYVKFQLPTEEGEEASYLYLKIPTAPATKYYVHKKADDGTMQALNFQKTKISDLTSNAMGIIDNILLKDVLKSDGGDKTNAVLESLCYDDDGNPNTIGQLRNEGGALVDKIPLDAIMTAEKNALVLYLLYGHENIHFVPNGDDYDMLQKFIAIHDNKVYNEYGELLPESSYVLDTENKTYTVDDVTYDYTEDATQKVTLRGVDVNGDSVCDENDTVARCYLSLDGKEVLFEETVLGDFARPDNKLDTITDHLTVKDIFGDEVCDETSTEYNAILAALADCPVGEIGDEVKNVKLSAFLGDVSDNKILSSLSDSTLDTLSDDINNLTMTNIFGEEDVNSNSILKSLADKTIDELPDAIDALTVEDVLHDQIYNPLTAEGKYTDKNGAVVDKLLADGTINPLAINPTWKYLLKDETGVIHTEYQLTHDMNNLIENMKTNVHTATLNELYEDELIDKETLKAETLQAEMKFSVGGLSLNQTNFSDKMKEAANDDSITLLIGDCTVEEMLVYINALLDVLH